jgi:hypothetical protein
VLFSIINKILMVIDRNLQQFTGKTDQYFLLNEAFASALQNYFDYKSIYEQ